MKKAAVISGDGLYRYALIRHWGAEDDWIACCRLELRLPHVVWVMLNPSTADASIDDPTIRKCIGFTKRWGFSALSVINLFALRATYPEELKRARDPVGPANTYHWQWHLTEARKHNDLIVAAWGNHGHLYGRDAKFKTAVGRTPIECLGMTKRNQPRHPLMLSYKTPRVPFDSM